VAPSRQGADKQEDQDDDQDESHAIPLLSFFAFHPSSPLKRFQDVLGIAHEWYFCQTEALSLHRQPHNFCNNKPESFSISSCLCLFIMTFIRMTDEDHERVTANNLPIAEGKSEVLIYH
jgi:hypothetical protein